MKKALTIFTVFILVAACGNKKQATPQKPASTTKVVEAPQVLSAAQQAGQRVYSKVCLACHQVDGSGVPGMHPPIIESKFVNGNPDKLIQIILEGMSGEIEVNGDIYNSIMPPHVHLSNKEIADVLTYVRSNFGNNSGPISVEQVQKNRDRKK